LRKLLVIAVLVPVLGGIGWWYFREQQLPDYGPAFREFAYVTNGKSNTVSVIDLRYFRLAKTLHVGSDPTGIAANSTKNEIYVVNSGSNNVTVINAETNTLLGATFVGPQFSELVQAATLAIVAKVPVSLLRHVVAPHPTVNQVWDPLLADESELSTLLNNGRAKLQSPTPLEVKP